MRGQPRATSITGASGREKERKGRKKGGMTKKSDTQLWERLPNEPLFWFARFRTWLAQDLPRSVLRLYRQEHEKGAIGREKAGKGEKRRDPTPFLKARTIPHAWRKAKRRYRWLERADAWDEVQFAIQDQIFEQKREREIAEYIQRLSVYSGRKPWTRVSRRLKTEKKTGDHPKG